VPFSFGPFDGRIRIETSLEEVNPAEASWHRQLQPSQCPMSARASIEVVGVKALITNVTFYPLRGWTWQTSAAITYSKFVTRRFHPSAKAKIVSAYKPLRIFGLAVV
jgi:hypothetical protein